MIGVTEETIGQVPSMVVVDANRQQEPLPVLVYFHGFTSAKEHNLPLAYLMAEKGYRVILPDSKYHGEREGEISTVSRQISFWDIVLQNVEELETVKTSLDEAGLIKDERFGVAGTSMGGITTTAALARYPWIKAAAVLMGSPKITTYAKTLVESFQKMADLPVSDEMINQLYEQLKQYDLSKNPEKLMERPLLFWHGKSDAVVPFDHSYTFYESIRKSYMNEEDIQFIKEKNTGHKVSREAVLKTVDWFSRKL
ncbi:esterase [Lentibacillus sediminis]|uniref:esterase n=1 Tax=Lentibacillus sediminis TaxID=1940529 RepID=UPI000C1C5BB3|nr:esterase [Lentibacillus sediminis]